jgi:hypothetical protein
MMQLVASSMSDSAQYDSVQMQRHPFFLRDLPPGVAEMNDRLVPPGAPSIKSFCMPEGVQARPAAGTCAGP